MQLNLLLETKGSKIRINLSEILKSDSSGRSSKKGGLRPLETFNQREEDNKEPTSFGEHVGDINLGDTLSKKGAGKLEVNGGLVTRFLIANNRIKVDSPAPMTINIAPDPERINKIEDQNHNSEVEDSESEDDYDVTSINILTIFLELFAARNEEKKIKFRASN